MRLERTRHDIGTTEVVQVVLIVSIGLGIHTVIQIVEVIWQLISVQVYTESYTNCVVIGT